jgi:hypothetical protein
MMAKTAETVTAATIIKDSGLPGDNPVSPGR